MRFANATDRSFALEKVRLPLIALIDVVLILLLYFMLSGTFTDSESHLESSLRSEQRGGGGSSSLVDQVLYASSRGDTTVFRLGDRVFDDRDALVAVLEQLPRDNGIVVRAASSARVADVAAAIQACKNAGFDRVSYVPQE